MLSSTTHGHPAPPDTTIRLPSFHELFTGERDPWRAGRPGSSSTGVTSISTESALASDIEQHQSPTRPNTTDNSRPWLPQPLSPTGTTVHHTTHSSSSGSPSAMYADSSIYHPRTLPPLYPPQGAVATASPTESLYHHRPWISPYRQTYSAGQSSSSSPPTNETILLQHQQHRTPKQKCPFARHVTDFLKNWFQEHSSHPYPTEDEKKWMCSMTQLSLTQINDWFINARRRNLARGGGRVRKHGDSMGSSGSGQGGLSN